MLAGVREENVKNDCLGPGHLQDLDQIGMILAAEGPGAELLERVIPNIDQNDLVRGGPGAADLTAPVIGLQFIELKYTEIGAESGQRCG